MATGPLIDERRSFDRTVYIIDDEEALRRTIRRVLTSEGIYTQEFATAEEFLAVLKDLPLGCILLDLRLPGMDGLELLRQIREDSRPFPVVMLSGHGDIPSAVTAVKTGAVDFLQKPFRPEVLLKAVKDALTALELLQSSRSRRLETLTAREKDLLFAFADGASNRMVAERLGLGVRTVEMHRARVLEKLGVENLIQALFLAKDAGYLDAGSGQPASAGGLSAEPERRFPEN